MRESDTILATGGPGMVKAAYSSGTPALGVGAGNASAIIDSSADIVNAVNSIIHSKTFDNGMICLQSRQLSLIRQFTTMLRRNSSREVATSLMMKRLTR